MGSPSSSSTSTIVDFRRSRSPERQYGQQEQQQQQQQQQPSLSPPKETLRGDSWLDDEISRLSLVVSELRTKPNAEERLAHLLRGGDARVSAFLQTEAGRELEAVVASSLPAEDAALLWTLPAIGQGHVLASALLPDDEDEEDDDGSEEEGDGASKEGRGESRNGTSSPRPDGAPPSRRERGRVVSSRLSRLAAGTLRPVDRFYGPIDGVAGYQLACLRLLRAGNAARDGAAAAAAAAAADRGGGEQRGRRNSPSSSSPKSNSLSSSPAALPGARISPPPGPDLSDEREAASARAEGLRFLPRTAEIVALGGAGDRLGLSCDSTGEALPAALLPYAGRSLLEGIVRDLQAREYLHWRALGSGGGGGHGDDEEAEEEEEEEGEQQQQQLRTRVALMTSGAKGGDRRVRRLLERHRWFGRGESSFRVFCQPQVPLVAAGDGRWLSSGACVVERRPGGHGALWKVLSDGGAFSWLREGGASAAVVRQVNNPLAGTDGTLLALAGEGAARGAAFGFACCPRRPGAAEGAVVLLELPAEEGEEGGGGSSSSSSSSSPSTSTTAHVTCVEYTEFEAAGLGGNELEALPANSNLLFVDLAAAEAAVAASGPSSSSGSSRSYSSSSIPFPLVDSTAEENDVAYLASGALPGVVFNSSKEVEWRDVSGGGGGGGGEATGAATAGASPPRFFPTLRRETAGRLESTMQNLVDHMPAAKARIQCAAGETGHCAEVAFAGDACAAAAAASATATSSSSSSPLSSSSKKPHLPTFALRGPRRRITSSAKRARKPGGPAAQTPEGSFLDLCRNAADLLARCGVSLPLEFPKKGLNGSSGGPLAAGDAVDAEAFLAGRPPFLFLFHPALGPTWDVVAQKIKGGALAEGSELVLEVAEARVVDLRVKGSLLVSADSPLGHWTAPFAPSHSSPSSSSCWSATAAAAGDTEPEEALLIYSSRNGRARLEDVEVDNAGVDWGNPLNAPFWRHGELSRHEAADFHLRGRSELDARGVTLRGGVRFEVPDGKRLVLRPRAGGAGRDDVEATFEDLDALGSPEAAARPSWEWRVSERRGGAKRGGDDDGALPGLDLTLVEREGDENKKTQ